MAFIMDENTSSPREDLFRGIYGLLGSLHSNPDLEKETLRRIGENIVCKVCRLCYLEKPKYLVRSPSPEDEKNKPVNDDKELFQPIRQDENPDEKEKKVSFSTMASTVSNPEDSGPPSKPIMKKVVNPTPEQAKYLLKLKPTRVKREGIDFLKYPGLADTSGLDSLNFVSVDKIAPSILRANLAGAIYGSDSSSQVKKNHFGGKAILYHGITQVWFESDTNEPLPLLVSVYDDLTDSWSWMRVFDKSATSKDGDTSPNPGYLTDHYSSIEKDSNGDDVIVHIPITRKNFWGMIIEEVPKRLQYIVENGTLQGYSYTDHIYQNRDQDRDQDQDQEDVSRIVENL